MPRDILKDAFSPRCPSTDEGIKKLWYIHTMEYYSVIKRNTFELVLMRWMNLQPIIQSEVSKRKTNMESRKMVLMNVLTNGESSMEIYTVSYVKQIASGNLLNDSGSSNLGDLEGWGGREAQEGGDICIPLADSR